MKMGDAMRVTFIGLGTMGAPMANRLLDAGFEVVGWDATESARRRFSSCAATLGEALEGTDTVVTMLPEGRDVASVYREAVFQRVKADTLLLDCSTIDVETTRDLAHEAAGKQCIMIDAPVSGGAEGAGKGTLSFMTGGAGEALERARPLLEAMGSKITHFGSSASGQAAKACHNMICGITALGVCEAFALADALGLDGEKFFNLYQGAAAQSWVLENRCPVPGPAPNAPSSNGYAPGFAARLMAKDLRLAQEAARSSGQATPFGADAAKRFSDFAASDNGDLDFSAIYRTIRTTR
ncbi:MAG: 3-hydroxyisobutyrate dehydrogenase [Hyphomicrobiaceae bacterium]